MRRLKSLQDVVEWDLCTGCGACAYACTRGAVSLINIASVGIRPRFELDVCTSCNKCLSICPGYAIDCKPVEQGLWEDTLQDREIGFAVETWEGFATDPEIRFNGSSGGVLSALALYCLEHEEMQFVLHVGMDEKAPWGNRTFQSRSRADILARTGSRYAPASPCEELSAIEDSPGPCVFIGKPCDAAAVAALRRQRPGLSEKLGLVLTFFCAGTPSSKGTLDLIQSLDIFPEAVTALRYRGHGWPGKFRVQYGHPVEQKALSYEESWGQLSGYRPLRCHLCPDGLGATADISCGDAWHKIDDKGNPGVSIVIVRTQRGKDILHRAIAANYVTLHPMSETEVITAQPNLVARRKELFGRLLAMWLLLVPAPNFKGFSLFRSWSRIPRIRRLKTVLGTMRRLIFRNLLRRRARYMSDVTPYCG